MLFQMCGERLGLAGRAASACVSISEACIKKLGYPLIITAMMGVLGGCLSEGGGTTQSSADAGDNSTIGDGSTTGDSSGSDTTVPAPGPGNAVPIANTDAVAVNDGVASVINVLANDAGLTDTPVTLTISAQPTHGTISVRPDNTIVYTANSSYAGADSFTYRITDVDGETALASVSIQVTCASCPVDRVMTLSWNPNTDTINGYQVFHGPTADQATTLLTDLPLNSGLVDPTAPQIQYRASADLGLSVGEQACFRVKAYANDSYSDYSQAVCGVN